MQRNSDVIVCVSGVHTNPTRNRIGPDRDSKPPPRVVSEICGFGHRICRLRLDGRPKRTRRCGFTKKIGSVWTGPDMRSAVSQASQLYLATVNYQI